MSRPLAPSYDQRAKGLTWALSMVGCPYCLADTLAHILHLLGCMLYIGRGDTKTARNSPLMCWTKRAWNSAT